MHKELEVIQDEFLTTIGNLSNTFGLNGFVATLYGFLYLNIRPYSLDELTGTLSVSKGNVSINIRLLEKLGIVKKVWVKGSRKDYYQAEPDIKKVFFNKVKLGVQKRISEISDMLEKSDRIIASIDGKLTPEDKAILAGYQERLKNIEGLKKMASAALMLSDRLI